MVVIQESHKSVSIKKKIQIKQQMFNLVNKILVCWSIQSLCSTWIILWSTATRGTRMYPDLLQQKKKVSSTIVCSLLFVFFRKTEPRSVKGYLLGRHPWMSFIIVLTLVPSSQLLVCALKDRHCYSDCWLTLYLLCSAYIQMVTSVPASFSSFVKSVPLAALFNTEA